MRKVIVLEDETKDGSLFRAVERRAKSRSFYAVRVKRVEQATLILQGEEEHLVIIHHYEFEDVDRLRAGFPKIKYETYSGNLRILLEVAGDSKENITYSDIQQYKNHYDGLIYNLGTSLDKVLDELLPK